MEAGELSGSRKRVAVALEVDVLYPTAISPSLFLPEVFMPEQSLQVP